MTAESPPGGIVYPDAQTAAAAAALEIASRYAALPRARSRRGPCPKCGGVIFTRRFIVDRWKEFAFYGGRFGGGVASHEVLAETLRVTCATCRYEVGQERPNDAPIVPPRAPEGPAWP